MLGNFEAKRNLYFIFSAPSPPIQKTFPRHWPASSIVVSLGEELNVIASTFEWLDW